MKLFILSILMVGVFATKIRDERQPRAPLDEDFGYVDVRTGAHMFWVTYHTDGTNSDGSAMEYTTAPLIMWLQGGPGSSGVSYGNFAELGPEDMFGNPRFYRWTKKGNVMFVDNPVGTGYSYVDDLSLLTITNQEIADDLVALVKGAFAQQPEYENMPFYVYCESYGGKMAADFALAFDAAIKNGEVVSNFMGVGLGDSWISPMDSVNTWGSFLFNMGFVNEEEQAEIEDEAQLTQNAVDAGNWGLATNLWALTEGVVERVTDGVNFYNVLTKEDIYYKRSPRYLAKERREKRNGVSLYDELDDFMNSAEQRARWNIPAEVTFGSQSGSVFGYLQDDFMKPVVDSVAALIDNTDIHVAVYSGDLDLICDTPGAYLWVENMNYATKAEWEATGRQPMYVSSYSSMAGYVQRYEDFSLFTILRAGHMVPLDAGEESFLMIDMIEQYANEAKAKREAKEIVVELAKKEIPSLKEIKEDLKPVHHVHPAYSQKINKKSDKGNVKMIDILDEYKFNEEFEQILKKYNQENGKADVSTEKKAALKSTLARARPEGRHMRKEGQKIHKELDKGNVKMSEILDEYKFNEESLQKVKEYHQNKKANVSPERKAALKSTIANQYKTRATPEGRHMRKEGHYDSRKPLFHQ